MTTCAWDGVRLAADTQGEASGMRINVEKIFDRTLSSGMRIVVAGSGAHGYIYQVFDDLCVAIDECKSIDLDHYRVKDIPEDELPGILLFCVEGKMLRSWRLDCRVFRPLLGKYAIGSGRDFAMAAMYLGHSAEKAVEVAMALDAHSGGAIQVLGLQP
jgi:ATP-dependent protease HslVU (ClpYQ) peptidase subunit